LWHNLAEAVERAVVRHRSCLQEPPEQPGPGPEAEAPAAPAPEGGLATRTRARHSEVHTALARGLTITEISRTLRLERKTVRRYATAATPDQLIGGTRLTRPSLLGPYQAYLRQRWDKGRLKRYLAGGLFISHSSLDWKRVLSPGSERTTIEEISHIAFD
jgi:hypothetical protein